MTKTFRPEPAYDLARWVYGEVGLSTEDLMRPSDYSRARDLSHWPDRKLPSGLVRCEDGLASIQARSLAAHVGQESYALRVELGDRAYAELTGKRISRKPSAKASAASRKTEAKADVRLRADGGRPVVLSDHEMMLALGIKPIGYLD